MKRLGRISALAGLVAAVWLVAREHPRQVLALVREAAPGLVLAALAHVLPMLANARLWQRLLPRRQAPALAGMLRLVWIRESVNGLLPVAKVGGEVAAFHLLRRRGVSAPAALSSLIVDLQFTVLGQLMFTLAGVAYLLRQSGSGALHLASALLWGLMAAVPAALLFALLQHARPLGRLAGLLNRVTGGQLAAIAGPSARADRLMLATWRRPGVVAACLLFWQPVQCAGAALELWLALRFLGAPIAPGRAFVFEALIQAAGSAAFFVPGALGVQEGGFLLIGAALGLGAPVSLALAAARRLRDLLVYVPGLVAWQAG